ncbi:MAG TPA: DUF4430 domain-containing protein [Pirellulales bacterium]|jgi:hypothetical protein|nr:DUF4430 domain-containing protein [Pirellulales bacterium]
MPIDRIQSARRFRWFPSAEEWSCVIFALVSLFGFTIAQKQTTAAAPSVKPIMVEIDYGDGVKKEFAELELTKDQTVLGALQAAHDHPHGIKFVAVGTGAQALVEQIDDLKNEGGGAKAKNWMFRVNGKEAERGAGDFSLSAGDRVLWRFAIYEYNSK